MGSEALLLSFHMECMGLPVKILFAEKLTNHYAYKNYEFLTCDRCNYLVVVGLRDRPPLVSTRETFLISLTHCMSN